MQTPSIPRLLITPGEPAGIGPDLTIQMAQQAWPAEIIAISDQSLLAARAQQLGLNLKILPADFTQPATPHQPGTLKVLHTPLLTACTTGQLNPGNAPQVIRCIELAVQLCLENKAQALVTGPVHKGIINEAGIPFHGHTELLAQLCHAKKSLMLFVAETAKQSLKVALLTTHIPLAKVPAAITTELLIETIQLLDTELKQLFQLATPRILVCGLNPHAGEGGYLGREEIDVMIPALNQLRAQGIHLTGPAPADTVFTEQQLKTADVVLAMYHDQGLPVVKHFGFHCAVNITLGLPILRTSVDHGTALDLAGTGTADSGSMQAAVKLALSLLQSRHFLHR